MAERLIEVIALRDGQTESGEWVHAGEAFSVRPEMVSRMWMKRADGKPWPEVKEDPLAAGALSADHSLDALRESMAIERDDAVSAAKREAEGEIARANDRADVLQRQLDEARLELAEAKQQLEAVSGGSDDADTEKRRLGRPPKADKA